MKISTSDHMSSFHQDIQESDIKKYLSILTSEEHGFFRLADNDLNLQECLPVYEKFKKKKYFVQIGIGGSSLGPEMLIQSLANTDTKFIFINNIDADEIHDQLKNINVNETLFYVVSKSGGTAETMAALAITSQLLSNNGVKENEFNQYLVFSTDPQKSQLREIANELHIDCLQIPSNIGGRFSVLTSVGILPALFAGIQVDELIKGASEIKPFLQSDEFYQIASQIVNAYSNGYDQTVMLPYSSKMRKFSDWFVQLWAESLGKIDSSGKNLGLTPVAAYGATDQHSQVQLFTEGPKNKIIFFIEILNRKNDYALRNNFQVASMQKLAPFSLNQLMKAEFEGSKKAFEAAQVPYFSISLNQLSEKYIGQCVLFFECLTALTGVLLKINPFNQPGVEAGKVFAFEWLEKQG